jgi:hypothetical protein
MPRLRDVTTLIRSKNAGPFLLTLDVIFDKKEIYERVVAVKVLSRETISSLYQVPVAQVEFFLCPEILAIKATLPRLVSSGDVLDTDVYGAQQLGPLLDIEVPGEEGWAAQSR